MTPEEMRVGFDLRVPPSEQEAVDLMLEEWCNECDVTIVWDQVSVKHLTKNTHRLKQSCSTSLNCYH